MLLRRRFVELALTLLFVTGAVPVTADAGTSPVAAADTTASAAASPTASSATAQHHEPACPREHRDPAGGNYSPPNPPQEHYFRGDPRLGPKDLPTTGLVGAMLVGYHRLDGFTATAFIACFWRPDPGQFDSTVGNWWYPDDQGFVLVDGRPLKRPVRLAPGQRLDLFGSGNGMFLAPAGTPYEKRAIPPSSLDTYPNSPRNSYHLYVVVKTFTVDAGPIRPWFGQPGLGLQYVVNPAYTDGLKIIPELKEAGYLREVS